MSKIEENTFYELTYTRVHCIQEEKVGGGYVISRFSFLAVLDFLLLLFSLH